MKKVRNILFIIVISLIGFLNFNIRASADTKEPTCPSGYSRVGSSYTCKKEERTGKYSCPSDYKLKGTKCYKKQENGKIYPNCSKKSGKTYLSSESFCKTVNKCVCVYKNDHIDDDNLLGADNRSRYDSTGHCGAGYTITSNGYCTHVIDATPEKKTYTGVMNQCPSGYTYNSKTKKCESKNDKSPSNNATSTSSNTNTNSKPKTTTTKKEVIISFTSSTFKVDAGKSKTVGIKIEGAKIKDTTVKIENTKIATVKKIKKNGKSYIQVKGKKKGKTTLEIQVKGEKEKLEIQVNKKNTQTKEENEAENTVNEGITDISQEVENNGETQVPSNNSTQIKTIKCPSKTPTVEVGKTKKINYKVNPSDANTDNINVIVKGGSKDNIKITSKSPLKVKGIKKGTGKIVFKYNGKTTTCKIKVEKGTTSSKKTSTKSTNNNAVKTVTITGSKTINKGETKTYIANVSPSKANGKVTWKSSNTKIATISSNGQLTAKKTGTVTITATSKENSKIKGTKKITINKKEMKLETGSIVKVESISIPSSKSITVDGKSKLKVTYIPENSSNSEIIWKTSDKKIVTVDSDGTVVGHKVGTAIVTATSKDNKNATANCTITVGKKVNVTNVELSSNTQTINIGEKLTINSVVLPETASNKGLSWKTSNEKVATVKNGIVTGKKKGTVTITATSKSDITKKATIKITVAKVKSNTTSKESNKSDDIKVTGIVLGEYPTVMYVDNIYNELSENVAILPYTEPKSVKYKSSKNNVVSVSSKGVLTAKKAGTSTITITSEANPKIKVSFKVKVKYADECLNNKCVANIKDKLLVGGDKTGYIDPNVDVIYGLWSSDDENIISTELLVGGTTYIPWTENGEFVPSDYMYIFTDSNVASIDETGKITALKEGTTYLKLISKLDGQQYGEMLKIDVVGGAQTNEGTTSNTSTNNTNTKPKTTTPKLVYKNTKIWPVKDLVIYKNSQGSSSTGKNVKKGSTLKILDHKNKRFKIKYNGTTGWISRNWVMIDMVTFDKRLEYPMPNASSPIYYLKDNNGKDTKIATKKLYKSKICALMYDTAIMLSKAQDKAAKDGYTLVVYDAYRPQTVTKYLYDKASDMVGSGNKYNSPLGNLLAQNVSTHNYGVAVDITLKKNGKELNMPTKIHYIGTSAGNTNSNSKKLAKYMTSSGFDPLVSNGILLEWWHFQNNDSINYKVNICNFNSNIQKSSSNNGGSWNWEEID